MLRRNESQEAIFSFVNGELLVDLGGLTAIANAEGTWPGEARTSALFVLKLKKALPKGDFLTLRYDQDRLYIEGISVPCIWQDLGAAKANLALGVSLTELLRARSRYTDAEIKGSGLTDAVRKAVGIRDGLIEKAAKILTPLELEPEEIYRLITKHLRTECIKRDGSGN